MALCWQGIKDGIITPERLDEAVTRILATKAALGLHRGAPELDVEKAKTIVGCAKHQQWAEECADKAITLVKEQSGVLPITPERYKKILFYTIEPAAGGEGNYKVARPAPSCAPCWKKKALRSTILCPSLMVKALPPSTKKS